MKKLFFTLICILAIFSPFFLVFAQQEVQLLEPSALGQGAPAAPDFQTYIQSAFTQILIIAAVLAVLMIVIGGLQYILSFSGSSKEEGRKRMTYAVGGLILALAAWLILNTINGSLTSVNFNLTTIPAPTTYTGPEYGPNGDPNNYNKCEQLGFTDCQWKASCSGTETAVSNYGCPYPGQNASVDGLQCCSAGEIPINEQVHYLRSSRDGTACYTRSYPTQASCNQAKDSGEGDLCIPAANFSAMNPQLPSCGSLQTSGNWKYDAGIQDQFDDASPEVLALVSCLDGKVDTSKYKISSISDNNHRGSRMSACLLPGCPDSCVHSCGSCHYGKGTGKSLAIDIVPDGASGSTDHTRNPDTAIPLGDTLVTAATECGGQTRWQVPGHFNHVHISVNNCVGG